MPTSFKPEHLEHLRRIVTPHDTEKARKGAIRRGDSDMRYRWDCLWAAKQNQWVYDTLFPYLNDNHIDLNDNIIDSALRTIIPNLNQGE